MLLEQHSESLLYWPFLESMLDFEDRLNPLVSLTPHSQPESMGGQRSAVQPKVAI